MTGRGKGRKEKVIGDTGLENERLEYMGKGGTEELRRSWKRGSWRRIGGRVTGKEWYCYYRLRNRGAKVHKNKGKRAKPGIA